MKNQKMAKQRNKEEDKLQASIVLWFGQTWPEFQDLLFEVYNNPSNLKHAMHRKSMGMKSGVADLILIQPSSGKCFGLELKAPRSKHSYSKIGHQIKWGVQLITPGGGYIMSGDIDFIKNFITAIVTEDKDSISSLQIDAMKYIDEQLKNKKTIEF